MSKVNEAFQELLSRIELNRTRVALASQRYNAVKRTVEGALPGKRVRQIGSFQRATKVRARDLSDSLDIDAIVSFGDAHRMAPPGEGITTQEAMNSVRSALQSNQTYRVMNPYADASRVLEGLSQGRDRWARGVTARSDTAASLKDTAAEIPGPPDIVSVGGPD